jgi:predicted PurR-regulated permease PerM
MSDLDTSPKTTLTFSKKVWIVGGIFSLIIILLLLFKTLFNILLLSLAAILIALFFHGCANLLHRYFHWNSKLCVVLSVLINILLLVAFFWFVGARLSQQISELSSTLPATIQNVKEHLNNSTIGGKIVDYLNATGSSEKTMKVAEAFFSSSFGVLSDLYIVLLLAIFFTASPSIYKKGIIRLLPPNAKNKGAEIMDKLKVLLEKWIKGQIIGFIFITVLTAIGLFFLKMPLILTIALIAGLLNMIPNFGPIIALIPAVLLALTQGTTIIIILICMYTFVQILQSAVEQPLIQQKMVNIPPAVTIFAQVALGLLAGFWGVLLCVPVIAIIRTIVDELYVNKQTAKFES